MGRQSRTTPLAFPESQELGDYGQVSPQIEEASPTQMLSQVTLQQYESCAQISAAQVSHPFLSFAPVLHSLCLHVPMPPPPLLLPPDELLLLELPPEPEPLPPLLPPPPQVWPQMEPTSLTQIESHSVLQQ